MKKFIPINVLILTLVSVQSLNTANASDRLLRSMKTAGQRMGETLTKPFRPTSSFNEQADRIQSIMSQIATLRSELKALAMKRGRLRNLIFDDAPDSAEATDLKSTIGGLGRQMGGLAGQRTRVRNKLTALLGTKSGEVPSLKEKLADYTARLSSLGQQKRSLEKQFDNFLLQQGTPAQSAELTTLDTNINQLGERIRNLEARLDNLLMR